MKKESRPNYVLSWHDSFPYICYWCCTAFSSKSEPALAGIFFAAILLVFYS